MPSILTKKIRLVPYHLTDNREKPTYFSVDTPLILRHLLERLRKSKERISIYYGDPKTGKAWGDKITGTVGRSTGITPILLIIKTSRSMGGEGILDNSIIRIESKKQVIYKSS